MAAATVLLLALTAGCASTPGNGDNSIGVVIRAAGLPSVMRNGQTYMLDSRSRIFAGDILVTGKDSRIVVKMSDGTQIALGYLTHFSITRYDYRRGKRGASADMTFSSGSFRANTGKITEGWGSRFVIRTPLAMINANGNDFWGGFIFGDKSLDVAMISGDRLLVTNDHGATEIREPGFGSTVIAGSAPQSPLAWTARKEQQALDATNL